MPPRRLKVFKQFPTNSTSIWILRRNEVSIQRHISRALNETDSQKIAEQFAAAQADYVARMDELDKYNLSGPDMLCVLDSNILAKCVEEDFEIPNIAQKMNDSYECPQYEFAA